MNREFIRSSEPETATWAGPRRIFWVWRRTVTVVILGAFLIGGFLILRLGSDNETLAQARQKGVIRIGYAIEPPYAFLDANGKVTGEFPEVARVIATRLGISRIEWHLTDFDSLIHELDDRDFDVVAAGMFITPERKQAAAFSLPICKVNPALLVQMGNPKQLHSYADILRNHHVRVAVLSGSVEEKFLLHRGISATRLVRVPDAFVGMQLVNAGEVDALALSEPTIRWTADHDHLTNVEMAMPFKAVGLPSGFEPGYGAFAFRTDDRSLRRAWNSALKQFLGTAAAHRIASKFDFSSPEPAGGGMNREMTAQR